MPLQANVYREHSCSPDQDEKEEETSAGRGPRSTKGELLVVLPVQQQFETAVPAAFGHKLSQHVHPDEAGHLQICHGMPASEMRSVHH